MDEVDYPMAGSWNEIDCKLSNVIKKTLWEDLKFQKMAPVQAAVIPPFLNKRDVIVQAATGSGKTLAYVIPVLEILMKRDVCLGQHEVGAVVLVPTRELAMQVHQVFQKFAEKIEKVGLFLAVGGTNIEEDLARFETDPVHVIVGTPGRFLDFISRLRHRLKLNEMEVLVLDEGDRLLELGFQPTLSSIMSKIPKNRRTALFSATQTNDLAELSMAGVRKPIQITLTKKTKTTTKNSNDVDGDDEIIPKKLDVYYFVCEYDMRFSRLICLLKNIGDREKIIVYFLTCACVDYYFKLCSQLKSLKSLEKVSLHGRVPQKKRILAYNKFLNLKSGVLFCTDVAARGLDVPKVNWIVQYDAPQDPKVFVHRVGRSARMGNTGNSLIFLSHREQTYIDLLKLRKISLVDIQDFPTPFENINARNMEQEDFAKNLKNEVFQHVLSDRDIYLKGLSAFVSFVRGYKEHHCNYIFRFKDISLENLVKGFYLLKLPSMKEFRSTKINFDHNYNVDSIKFKDKKKEKQRIEKQKQKQKQRQKKRIYNDDNL